MCRVGYAAQKKTHRRSELNIHSTPLGILPKYHHVSDEKHRKLSPDMCQETFGHRCVTVESVCVLETQ